MIKSRSIFIATLLFFIPLSAEAQNEIVIGSKFTISSAILNEEREYWAYLPESYDRSSAYTDYPVLYLLDGEKLFHQATGIIKQMSADATPQIPEMIVVGIVSQQRIRDSSPTNSLIGYEGQEDLDLVNSGGADNFLAFINQELIPHIDRGYSTVPYRIFVGYSFTGLTVLHALYTTPSFFNAYIAIDPSLWWDNATMLQQVEEKIGDEEFRNRALFMSTTQRQPISIWPESNFVADFIEVMQANEIEGLQFFSKKYGIEENHHTMPLISLYDGLNQIFDGYMLKQGHQYDETPSELEAAFKLLSSRLGGTFLPPESVVDFYAGDLLYSDLHPNIGHAIEYFEMNTRNYPSSVRAWGRLGFAYAEVGETQLAIDALQAALDIEPNTDVVLDKLEELVQSSR